MRLKLSIAWSLLVAAQWAQAELYVSPVFRDSVRYNEPRQPAAQTRAADGAVAPSGVPKQASQVSGESSIHGQFVMDGQDSSEKPVLKYGRNVPLFVAMENIVPKDWMVNPEEGLTNRVVNWEGGNTWETVLRSIADQNGLVIVINQNERAVGVSVNPDIAKNLAMRVPQVWQLKSGLSLRENLSVWAKRAGWSLDWDSKLKIDYPITHDAVLTGPFAGSNGVVDKVLSSLRNEQKPLTAVFFMQNRVMKVREAGYRIEPT